MRLSALALGALLTQAAHAAPAFAPPPKPGPAIRKPAAVTWSAESLSVFADALLADKAGDLEKAHDFYRRMSSDDKLVPAVLYNSADVLRRMERYKDAIELYKKYLEAAPDASDRADVGKLIARLEATPPILTIDGDDPGAVIYVDGILVGPSPQTIQVTPGKHAVDRIGPTSYDHDHIDVKPLDVRHLQTSSSSKEETGNVVLSGGGAIRYSGSWRDGDRDSGFMWKLNGRMDFAPGRYSTQLLGRDYACSPLAFEVPKGPGVTFVFVDAPNADDEKRGGCVQINVKVKKVAFPR
ncbi:MAG: tetratricopeptide repeat protein [Deltaproteobacteria bacterium]|nr:tetratricopeptide repeat protein [Deltaproteobacteria bacterium]